MKIEKFIIVIRGVNEIACGIAVLGKNKVTVDIQSELKRCKRNSLSSAFTAIVHSYNNLNILGTLPNKDIMYDGDVDSKVLGVVLSEKWHGIVTGYPPLKIGIASSDWYLGYEDTYSGIIQAIKYQENTEYKPKKIEEFIERVKDKYGDNVDRDALNDIIVEHTAPKYNSRKRRK